MISFHQRMQKAGACRRKDHNASWVEEYTRLGLSEYLSDFMVMWPCLTIGYRSPNTLGAINLLDKFLSGWLDSIFDEPPTRILNRTAMCGLRSTKTSLGCGLSLSGGSSCSQGRSTAHLRYPLACMLPDGRTKIFQTLFSCGINPNDQSLWSSECQAFNKDVRRSIWQTWLSAVWDKLHTEEAEKRKHLTGFDGLNRAKQNINDLVAVFLQHGADPSCFICIVRHCDRKDCRLEPLESVLATITSHNHLSQLQALRSTYLTRSNQRATRFDRMFRAMRSWTASKRTAYSSDKSECQLDSAAFLFGFVRNVGGFLCDCSSECKRSFRFASAFCTACACGYHVCALGARRRFPDIPTRDDVSRYLVHECLPSDDPHEYVWFGRDELSKEAYRLYGVKRSISVLEDWYARNTNGEDATLD
jgi:hypothetical protein